MPACSFHAQHLLTRLLLVPPPLPTCVQALTGKPLTVYGDGSQTRSFQYISDLINGMVTVMDGPQIGPFNVGNPGEFTMMELAKLVQEVGSSRVWPPRAVLCCSDGWP